MSQNPTSSQTMIYKNVLAWRGCEKLYLDEETADVHFVFKTNGETFRLPAHKAILSATSPAFHAMFYGSLKQDGDIPIVDATPEAFREFLQNFYRSSVKVTIENIPEVIHLSKKYLVDEALNACADLCSKSTLTLENVCWGYELAILFEQDQLQKFCEQMISENAEQIFRSNYFMNCKPNLLRRILQLDSLKCNETVVFNACLQWAKNACSKKGLDRMDAKNLRAELGDMFFEIRFGKMAIETATACYTSHEGLFSLAEYKNIIDMITSGNSSAGKFNTNPRTGFIASKQPKILVCDRIDWIQPNYSLSNTVGSTNYIKFSSNCPLTLIRIECIGLIQGVSWTSTTMRPDIIINISISTERSTNSIRWVPVPNSDNIIDLSSPLTIKPNEWYVISIEFNFGTVKYALHAHKSEVKLDGDVIIKFHNFSGSLEHRGLITRLHFLRPSAN